MRRRKIIKGCVLASAVAPFASYGYGALAERHFITVERVRLKVGLPQARTLAVLGDIHWDPLFEADYITDVAARLDLLNPDYVLYTGDFISDTTERLNELAAILAQAKARFGHLAVLGNHDVWHDDGKMRPVFDKVGIRVLTNESVAVDGCPSWFISGIDSYWGGVPNPELLGETPAGSRHILLCHEPDPFDDHVQKWKSKLALQLSGHTHGGQVRAPLIGAIQLPSWGRNYDAGLFEKEGSFLYVNRGIGTVDIHCRFLCRPEITYLELS